MSKAFEKYLKNYAEPEANAVSVFCETWTETYQYGLMLPVYKEPITAIQRFIDFCNTQQQVLLILVINRPDKDPDQQWLSDYYTYFNRHFDNVVSNESQVLHRYPLPQKNSLLVIDRGFHAPPIPYKKGVGLARKIAADCISTLVFLKKIHCPWIFNTDADVHLPDNYFSVIDSESDQYSALVFDFTHQSFHSEAPQKETEIYEKRLHSYVDGLRYAGSPYAFHTIGSLIVINVKHYINARGFPSRAGAEDFYLLNKLAKLAAIKSLDNTIIIETRFSNRVPFGTGPAVQAIANNPAHQFQDYPSHCFHLLQQWLLLLNHIADSETELVAREKIKTAEYKLYGYVNFFELNTIVTKCFIQCKNPIQRKKYLHNWFDGFKTLKFINRTLK